MRPEEATCLVVPSVVAADASVLVVGPGEASGPRALHVDVPLADPALVPAVAVVPFQLLAWRLAGEQGRAPGLLSIATKVTRRE